MRAIDLIDSLDVKNLIMLFWFSFLFEIPRYVLGSVLVPISLLWRGPALDPRMHFTLSVVVAGHNEEKALPCFVESLSEQSILARLGHIELIVVDDGSTDRMTEIARELQKEGKIDQVLRLEQRGGKSAAINLGLSLCTSDIIIITDVDTTFDRDAFVELVAYFSNPNVGAVSGNLGVRNAGVNLITRYQAIEYAISISLGRCVSDALGTLLIVSGAFGAYRRAAIQAVGWEDVEAGDDADLTMKLRRAGWRIRFAPDAHALTDVPESVSAFTIQRLRWDRCLVTIWVRKYSSVLNPCHAGFRFIDALACLDMFYFEIMLGIAFPVYILWLIIGIGDFTFTTLMAMAIGIMALNILSFVAATVVGVQTPLSLFFYIPIYTFSQMYMSRMIRIVAVVQELIFFSSRKDPFIPSGVMSQIEDV
jgi:poly-beta-1,6-N-acetyl-D-glucosamine synthase